MGRPEGSRAHVVTLRDVAAYALVFVLILAPLALLAIGPVVYNRYFSVVGRGYSKVLRMDHCADAEALMRDAAERHSGRRDFAFHVERPAVRGIMGRPVQGSAYLPLYDWVFMDDVRLGVLCDAEGRIAEREFIGD